MYVASKKKEMYENDYGTESKVRITMSPKYYW